MRVLYVQTPFPEADFLGRSRSLRLVTNRITPLGLGYLAAVTRQAGHSVAVYAPGDGGALEDSLACIALENPDVIGLSVTTPYYMAARDLARAIRREFPGKTILLGGAHPTALPGETLGEIPADFVLVGEAERTVVEVLEHLEEGDRTLEGVAGVVRLVEGRAVSGPVRPPIEDLDSLPFPARDLMEPLGQQRPTPASYRRLPVGVLFTSRGCPYRCTFCDRSVFGNRFRARSPENVCDEIEELVERHGAREIRFFDDDFSHDKARAIAICEEMLRRGLRIPWTCLMNAHEADPELLSAFLRAGCWQVLYGLESGCERMLRRLKKPITIEKAESAIRLAHEAGLSVRADFLMGTPGETLEEMRETVEFAIRNRVEFAHFNKFMPYPGTEIHDDLVRRGFSFDFTRNWSDQDHGVIVYSPEGIDPDVYSRELDRSYRRFYLRPGYVLRRLLAIRTWTELRGQITGGLAILFL